MSFPITVLLTGVQVSTLFVWSTAWSLEVMLLLVMSQTSLVSHIHAQVQDNLQFSPARYKQPHIDIAVMSNLRLVIWFGRSWQNIFSLQARITSLKHIRLPIRNLGEDQYKCLWDPSSSWLRSSDSDVFNAKHLFPYIASGKVEDSRTNLSLSRWPDAASLLFLITFLFFS